MSSYLAIAWASCGCSKSTCPGKNVGFEKNRQSRVLSFVTANHHVFLLNHETSTYGEAPTTTCDANRCLANFS